MNVRYPPDMRLVVGPTSAGKTTFVERLRKNSSQNGNDLKVHLAFEISDGSAIPTGADDIVHFNLLRGQLHKPNGPISVTQSRLLPELIDAADEVVVLAAPRPVLLRRAGERVLCEPDHEIHADRRYDHGLWTRALKMRKLAQIYEHLALYLDQSGKPHRYLCSNSDVHDDFEPLSRWDLPRLAGADSEQLCQQGHVIQQLDVSQRSYQADYRAGSSGAARSKTLSLALQMPLAGKRVLDIGCAEGAAALSAYRMGARVTAIEPWSRRFEQATTIAKTLDSEIDLRNVALEGLPASSDSYDVVLALNVIHHQRDPFAFLDRAADLASSHLVLEYPGPSDRKFQSTLEGSAQIPEDQPVIGLSTTEKDQTFVFTPASLERYLLDTVGIFGKHQLIPSPIPNRWLSVFSEKQNAAPQQGLGADARLRQTLASRDAEIDRLRGVIRDMRASRSWRLTAPLRKVTFRLRRGS